MTEQHAVVPPSSAARRAICLAALLHRAGIESAKSQTDAPRPDNGVSATRAPQHVAGDLNDWLNTGGLWNALSRAEKAILSKPVGELTRQELINSSWRAEALAAILWALGDVERLPNYDTLANTRSLLASIPLGQNVRGLIATATLRSHDDLFHARAEAELWHWRARTFLIQRQPDGHPPPRGKTYAEIIGAAVDKGDKRGLFSAINGDFPAFGKAYRVATEEEWYTLRSIASERHYAMNWLCSDGEDWDHVPTDT